MSCPICGKRPPKRFCPAKGEKICAVCCGREREVSIDCPLDCSYLIAAHRYEREQRDGEQRKPPTPGHDPSKDYPYKDVEFSVEFVYQHWPLVAGIATAILTFQSQYKDLRDSEIFTATERLAETYRTLGTGIYYERPPEALLPAALYNEIQRFLHEFRQAEAAHSGFSSLQSGFTPAQGGFTSVQSGFSSLKDSEIFQLFVFLLRMNKAESSNRPRSRAFIEFLRARFALRNGAAAGSPAAAAPEASRIIIP
ncbi:MAG: hypothetical protein ACRD40_11400 [Candidatus Acidiferrales bacterium]